MPPWIDIRAPLVNPLGNPLSQYSSATWINLGQPGVLVDFTALGTGTPLPAGTLPGGGTYTQAAGSGQTEETWVTSWTSGTLARVAFAANTPKIGVAPNGLVGLRLRQTWKNYVRNSDAFDAWTPSAPGIATANTTASPDGLTNADTLTDDDPAAFEFVVATTDAIPTDTERYRLDLFVGKTVGATHAAGCSFHLTGGTPIYSYPRLNANDGTVTAGTTQAFGASWWWLRASLDGNGTNTTATLSAFPAVSSLPLPGADVVAGQGAKVVYGCSITRGKLPRDYQPTPAGSGATCADCSATYPASRLVRGGRLRLRFRWTPSGAPTDYNTNFRIVDHGAEVTYCEFSATDQKLRIQVAGGAVETCAVPMWWPSASLYSTSHPVVEVDLEIGGNVATRIRYRYSTDGGVTWTLPFDPLGGAAGVAQGNVSSSGSIGVLTGAAAGAVADGWLHEHEAILTAPAWALQALPTDVAAVKAFFRADSSYTLSAGTVSAWGSLAATAGLGFAQGTAAQQPTYVAGGGPSGVHAFSFDGGGDSLVGANRASYFSTTDGEIFCGVRIDAASLGGAGAYFNFHGIVADNSGGLGLHYRTAGVLDAGNFAGSAQSAQGTYTLGAWTSLRWQHTGGNVSLGQDAGMGSLTSVASGATTATGAICVGNGAVGYLAGRVTDVIICSAALTAPELAIIRSYLTARGLP